MNKTINEFFTKEYNNLISISKDYSKRYSYNLLEPDEIVSELYLYTIDNANRTSKLEELISITAATTNYKYDTKAMYYLINIIYRITHGRRTFAENCNRQNINIVFLPVLFSLETTSDEVMEYDHLSEKDVTNALELISGGTNWYKYQVWYDYYKNNMTYRQLSEKYKLSISPIFYMLKEFNKEIKTVLLQS